MDFKKRAKGAVVVMIVAIQNFCSNCNLSELDVSLPMRSISALAVNLKINKVIK
jgi:hypothetical protein|tara:strand:+ start:309 stop:470 length:162 start_codon:yes stop_codon:yes gene_type:complete